MATPAWPTLCITKIASWHRLNGEVSMFITLCSSCSPQSFAFLEAVTIISSVCAHKSANQHLFNSFPDQRKDTLLSQINYCAITVENYGGLSQLIIQPVVLWACAYKRDTVEWNFQPLHSHYIYRGYQEEPTYRKTWYTLQKQLTGNKEENLCFHEKALSWRPVFTVSYWISHSWTEFFLQVSLKGRQGLIQLPNIK